MDLKKKHWLSAQDQLAWYEEAARRLDYNKTTGEVTWQPKPVREKNAAQWNEKYAGKVAGTINKSDRYRYIAIFASGVSRRLLAHRLAWFITTGALPKDEIDHINRDRQDNRFSNLRDVPAYLNGRNRADRPDNTSGYAGVTWNKKAQRWQAQANFGGKNRYLGLFANKDEAGEKMLAFRALHGYIETAQIQRTGEAA